MPSTRVVPVIICGGTGTRLWPLSREDLPKQFLPLLSGHSTFQHTLERVAAGELFDPPLVVTAADFRFLVAEQLRIAGCAAQIVLESARRDSGPAVAAATEIIARRDAAALVLVLAADHVIRDQNAFLRACREALPAAEQGLIVTFGLTPTFPSTEYGYIRPGARLDAVAHRVEAFAEKPGAATAARRVAEGCLWNSGNFLFRADVMLAEIARYEPAMAAAAKAAVDGAVADLDFLRLEPAAFARAPKKSIDHAVMERTSLAAVVRGAFDWSDVGSWNAVGDLFASDRHGNRVLGETALLGSSNNLVYVEEGMLVAVVGTDDLVIVATADAVLVVPRAQAGKVKALAERLQAEERDQALRHRRMYRPWGYYERIAAGTRHQVKRLVVNPGARLSLQKHARRAEHWVVVKGDAEVTLEHDVRILHENESVHIPIGIAHRLGNSGIDPIELIEVQIGDYLGEDDIVRLEDMYQRN